jgi:hypothetical protein
MVGPTPFDRSGGRPERLPRRRRGKWRAVPPPVPSASEQEDEVRARLYARPPATERTVEILGRVERLADRPAA